MKNHQDYTVNQTHLVTDGTDVVDVIELGEYVLSLEKRIGRLEKEVLDICNVLKFLVI